MGLAKLQAPPNEALQTDKDNPSCLLHSQKPRQLAFAAELGRCRGTYMRVISGAGLLLGVLLAIGVRADFEPPQEPSWRLDTNGGWCFYLSSKKACLPAEYELTEFEPGHAAWRYWKESGPIYLIRYEAGTPTYSDIASMADAGFLIVSSFAVSNVQVTELAADLSKPGSHKLSVLIAEFDKKFHLTLSGADTEGLRDLAGSLSEQWVDSSK